MVTLVTGATGFIGGHLAQALLRRGDTVRTLVRDPRRARCLLEQGMELVAGDLCDPESLPKAVRGADYVYHCAAEVGDWLDHGQARRVNVEGTRGLLDACASAGVRRVIHLSTLGVLGSVHHFGTDESAPLRYTGDAYIDSKIDTERLVQEWVGLGGGEAVILRPGHVYGPGDRQLIPRLLDHLASGKFSYIGNGSKQLNSLYIQDMEQAAFLAERCAEANGHAYNLTDGTQTSLREFVTFIARYLGLPVPRRRVPPAAAWMACYGMEAVSRLSRATEAPLLNRARMKFLYFNQHYCIEKARRELGYAPQFTYRDGLPPTLDWFRKAGALPHATAAAGT